MAEANATHGPPTPAQIIELEAQRGHQAWTGPEGNADSWYLATHYWNQETYTYIVNLQNIGSALGRLG